MSNIELHVEPQTDPMKWEQFVQTKPPFSIALDGYVHGAPQYDPTGPRENFNHHEDVDRIATSATCDQVLDAIRSGLFDKKFRDKGAPRAEIYVNDCDQDVCTAYYLLTHAQLAESAANPLINKLVRVEGKLDATAGAYPINPDFEIMRSIAWIFEPYTAFKNSKEYGEKSAKRNEEVIEACTGRIHEYVLGKGKEIPLDLSFDVLDKRPGYTVVRETGEHAKIGMFRKGIDTFISVRQSEPNKPLICSVGRRAKYDDFPVAKLFEAFNAVDPLVEGENRWGGGDLIGATPRRTGSGLTLEQVIEITDAVLQAHDIK